METYRMGQSEIVFVTNLQGQASKLQKNTLTEEQLKTQVALVKACDFGMEHCTVPKEGEKECKYMDPSIAFGVFERIRIKVVFEIDESATRIKSKGGIWRKTVKFGVPTHYDVSNRLDLAQLRGGIWHEIMELGFLRYFADRYGREYEWYETTCSENDAHEDVETAQKAYFYKGKLTGKKWGWPDPWKEWIPGPEMQWFKK